MQPRFIEPMKALGVAAIPPGRWLLENKFDGYRALAVREGSEVALYSRNRHVLTARYPEIAAAVSRLKCRNAVLDGEIVALDQAGRPRFQLLQHGAGGPLLYYIFDVLLIDGQSLLGEPIEVRRRKMEGLLARPPPGLRVSPVFAATPAALLDKVRAQGLEGIVAKAAGSAYEPGRRSGAWLKCRISLDQEFVIGGYTAPQRSRQHFGAILIGYYRAGKLTYAGKVGTGFDAESLARLHRKLQALEADQSPFSPIPEGTRLDRATWVKPRLVAQIRFSEWTRDGALRHPVFRGLRTDKSARTVVREVTAA